MRGSFCKELLLVTVVSTTCMSGSQLNHIQVKSVCLSVDGVIACVACVQRRSRKKLKERG